MIEQAVVDRSAAFEEIIQRVRGIQAVRVVTDPNGEIDEVHVVGSPSRTPKQIVRDIESILYLQGGVRMDHRKVSLVQLAEAPTPPAPVRLQLRSVAQGPGLNGLEVRVLLALNEREFEGASAVEPGEPGLLRAAAVATVQALGRLISTAGELQLEQIERQSLGSLPVCLSHITLSTDRGIEILLGISVIQSDVASAAARSVLDAVNRRVNMILGIG